MWFMLTIMLAPLIYLPLIRLLAIKATGLNLRRLKTFTWIYLACQLVANAYLWHCFLGGYQDWIMALSVPYLVAYIGIVIGAVFFLGSYISLRNEAENASPTSGSGQESPVN